MKCPRCGYLSFDRLETCKRCGSPLATTAATRPPAARDTGQLELSLESAHPAAPPAKPGRSRRRTPGGRIPSRRDDDAFPGLPFGGQTPAGGAASGHHREVEEVPTPDPAPVSPSGSSVVLPGRDPFAEGKASAERERKAGERRPAPEAAPLGPRAAALLADQAILAAVLALFYLGAVLALAISGFDAGHLFSREGLRAALAPFALLAALLSLAYYAFFHGSTGRTPGKALVGVEVCSGDGSIPTAGRAIVRWFGAALGLACFGLGLAWALLDPGRRSLADRLSGTVVAPRFCRPGDAPSDR